MKNKGFTLIEILAVVAILTVLGSIVVSVITITLRGTKKSDLLENARQNGDAALTQMVKGIRYASSLDNPNSCVPAKSVSSITVTSVTTHTQTTYSCTASSLKANNVDLFNTSSLVVSACSFTCAQTTLNNPPTITIQYTLSPASAGSFTETNFTLPFQSSVTMRNL
jgi:prepilin-type N-terminal cleavage/methylation domain-containing protein